VDKKCRTQEVKNLDGKAGVLAVLDELAEVGEAVLFGLGVLLDDGDDGVSDARLIVQAPLVPKVKFLKFQLVNFFRTFYNSGAVRDRSGASCFSGSEKNCSNLF
jgi:hypothetical protein